MPKILCTVNMPYVFIHDRFLYSPRYRAYLDFPVKQLTHKVGCLLVVLGDFLRVDVQSYIHTFMSKSCLHSFRVDIARHKQCCLRLSERMEVRPYVACSANTLDTAPVRIFLFLHIVGKSFLDEVLPMSTAEVIVNHKHEELFVANRGIAACQSPAYSSIACCLRFHVLRNLTLCHSIESVLRDRIVLGSLSIFSLPYCFWM